MKRPLMVLAAGYVLGEVLVLQVHGAEDMARMACVYAVAAMLLWWEETGALRRLFDQKKEQQETGIPGLSALFVMPSVIRRLWGMAGRKGEEPP